MHTTLETRGGKQTNALYKLETLQQAFWHFSIRAHRTIAFPTRPRESSQRERVQSRTRRGFRSQATSTRLRSCPSWTCSRSIPIPNSTSWSTTTMTSWTSQSSSARRKNLGTLEQRGSQSRHCRSLTRCEKGADESQLPNRMLDQVCQEDELT